MNEFIEWCNLNQGFVSAILALTSIILSVVAILVSIRVAKLPFQKKIAVAFYTNLGVGASAGLQFYSIEATNIGNRVIKVNFVGVGYKEGGRWMKCYNKANPNPSNVMLDINETVDTQYSISDVNQLMAERTLYAIAVDIEGKVYKRRIK